MRLSTEPIYGWLRAPPFAWLEQRRSVTVVLAKWQGPGGRGSRALTASLPRPADQLKPTQPKRPYPSMRCGTFKLSAISEEGVVRSGCPAPNSAQSACPPALSTYSNWPTFPTSPLPVTTRLRNVNMLNRSSYWHHGGILLCQTPWCCDKNPVLLLLW